VRDDRGANDPRERVPRALQAQLRARRAELDSAAARVGWKVDLHIAEVEEVMGPEPVFGYLTSATCLEPGGTFRAREDLPCARAGNRSYPRTARRTNSWKASNLEAFWPTFIENSSRCAFIQRLGKDSGSISVSKEVALPLSRAGCKPQTLEAVEFRTGVREDGNVLG
jgi:hypothetical protein